MDGSFANYLRVLEDSEWLRPRELAQFQAGRLAELVQHAYEHAPFYRERLAALFDVDGSLDLARWHEIPVLGRSDVTLHFDQMRVAQLPSEFGSVREVQTSGTLGMPLKVAINEAVALSTNAALARLVRWFGLDASRALASIRTYPGDGAARYPTGKTSKEWVIGRGGALYALDVATPIEQQLEWLSRVRAPYLLTYPSNAYALAEAVSTETGHALGIEAVFGFAETVPDGARELIAERFGAPLIPYYSTREVGVIAMQCPATPHYHLAAENVVVELLDDAGRDVPVGERGRVAITSLQNYAMPFIRYAIGDVAVASDRMCPCGRSLPVIERIEGRIRNAFTFRDGTRVWPRGWLAREMRAFVPFRQYQMVQKDFEINRVQICAGRNRQAAGRERTDRVCENDDAQVRRDVARADGGASAGAERKVRGLYLTGSNQGDATRQCPRWRSGDTGLARCGSIARCRDIPSCIARDAVLADGAADRSPARATGADRASCSRACAVLPRYRAARSAVWKRRCNRLGSLGRDSAVDAKGSSAGWQLVALGTCSRRARKKLSTHHLRVDVRASDRLAYSSCRIRGFAPRSSSVTLSGRVSTLHNGSPCCIPSRRTNSIRRGRDVIRADTTGTPSRA